MEITVAGLGKKFIQQWIFKDLNATFNTGSPTAITGPNGSGKSTLLQLLSGQQLATKGTIRYQLGQDDIPVESIYTHLAIAAPYLELIEEFKLDELLSFHFKFKPLKEGLSTNDFKSLTHLEKEGQKEVRKFSSGMKQRLKLGLCFFTRSAICLLDEPTANLDSFGVNWYLDHIQEVAKERLLIISSNQPHEYDCCTQQLFIPDFK